MTREEQLDWLYRLKSKIYVYMPKEWIDPMHDALIMTIKALEQEPCEDCISRQAVDDAIYDYSRSCDVNYAQIMEFIDKLPSFTPQQKKSDESEVLDKIRAEIDSHCSDNRDRNDGLYIAMRIIDKYQASLTGAEGSDKE